MRKFASIGTLMREFQIDKQTAQTVRGLVKGTIDPETVSPKTVQWVGQCYNRPGEVALILSALNDVLGMYGVEGLGKNDCHPYNPPFEYLNTGDSYATTIVYKSTTDHFFISSWGDVAENNPSLCRD
jgi:hypothetical protein